MSICTDLRIFRSDLTPDGTGHSENLYVQTGTSFIQPLPASPLLVSVQIKPFFFFFPQKKGAIKLDASLPLSATCYSNPLLLSTFSSGSLTVVIN